MAEPTTSTTRCVHPTPPEQVFGKEEVYAARLKNKEDDLRLSEDGEEGEEGEDIFELPGSRAGPPERQDVSRQRLRKNKEDELRLEASFAKGE